ncbi:metallophosphoesterase [Ectothiorhodospiraceae bacterium WFHF3C12]|nr:metallophosphoesterase [Ectothiorhodospiraceae bacterium WFHF3C12]
MALRILAVGDIHLGRRPSRLPQALAERARDLGPAGAWGRTVEVAIGQGVDAVVLAGDVIERDEDFYEGYRELQSGVSHLTDAGIRVLGVVGNHDVRVLPRLAAQIPEFHLLGQGGVWEAVDLGDDGEPLTLWGWSFPQERVPNSPVADTRFDRRDGPNLGLLHCDRDQPGSPYAPVSSAELRAAGLDGWLLGHIHAPDALTARDPSGYLGSLTGMDPGEPGAHGPWLITVERGRISEVAQQVLAPLHWAPVELDLTGIEAAESAQTLLLERVRQLDETLNATTRPPAAAGLRVRLTGRTGLGDEAAALFGETEREQVYSGSSGCHYFIERLAVETRPEIALTELAGRADPPGLLARRLLLLDRPADDPDRQALLAQARQRLDPVHRDPRWQALGGGELDDEAAAEWLRRSGTRLLERMLAQREDAA